MSGTILKFGEFTLDCDCFELRRAGRVLKLEKKPMELLILLATHRGDLVTRTEIAQRLWEREVFVDTEHGINTAVRKMRQILRDDPERPRFVRTVTGKGYRFIADVVLPLNGNGAHAPSSDVTSPGTIVIEPAAGPANQNGADPAIGPPVTRFARKRSNWLIAAGVCTILAIAGAAVFSSFHARPSGIKYTQLTDFTDSATAPALSPDGHMIAFFRGSTAFGTADQIWVKVLPDGEAKRVTDDPRFKYGPAFSPDGSQIAYTVLVPDWQTYTVSILGGNSHLFLNNAAGLTWLDEHQLLFSAIRSGMRMGVVTGTATRENYRELYFPAHGRGMAHYSYASPDRKNALVVEMDGDGKWAPCRLISLAGSRETRIVGPNGACTSAGWSPDGSWMYFTATVEEESHLWRQHFPDGKPEQITSGPMEEEGIAVEREGSIITSLGERESALWIHTPDGDRCLSSEGKIIGHPSPPSFSPDGTSLYYLARHVPNDSGRELWRMAIHSGDSQAVFPGVSMLAYDISPDGKEVVYSTRIPGGNSELWLAPLDKSYPAKQIGHSGESSPHFGPRGEILFMRAEGNTNYLERINPDGSGRSKVSPYPIGNVLSVSPGRHWVAAIASLPDGVGLAAIPVLGGPPRRVYAGYAVPTWSTNGKWLFVTVEPSTRTAPGRSLAIPVGPGEALPSFPAGGIPQRADASVMSGAQSIERADIVPGVDPAHYAYVNTTVHSNLYRISLP